MHYYLRDRHPQGLSLTLVERELAATLCCAVPELAPVFNGEPHAVGGTELQQAFHALNEAVQRWIAEGWLEAWLDRYHPDDVARAWQVVVAREVRVAIEQQVLLGRELWVGQ